MRGMFRYYFIAAVLIAPLFFAVPAQAIMQPDRGLLMSPPRYNMKVTAGASTSQQATIANYTARPLVVNLSVQEFSVANLSYEYQIKPANQPWLSLDQIQIYLKAGDSQTLRFTAHPPAGATPGGQYYLIVASATSTNGDLTSTIQVAAPVYITINGNLDMSSRLEGNHGMSRVVFGDTIPFHLDVTDTGNVHYSIDVKAHLDGVSTDGSTILTPHTILPGTTRHFESSVASPVLPGIYPATYGYSSDATGDVVIHTWVVYIPLWSIVVLVLLGWGSVVVIQRRRKLRLRPTDSPR